MDSKFYLPKKPLTVAILGSSGAVGEELMILLEERNFPIKELRLLASERSAGKKKCWKNQWITTEQVSKEKFEGVDLVFASAGGSVSKSWLKEIKSTGALLIDNSSAFRMDSDVPLVVPEVNPSDAYGHQNVIANPNCTTILLSLVLAPLSKIYPLKRVIVSTYQSVSGAGAKAMEELKLNSKNLLEGQKIKNTVLPYQLAFNLFLHNSPLDDNGYCEEEIKMLNETRKILHLPNLNFSATCVRVPVLRAHSESINIEFEGKYSLSKINEVLGKASGIKLIQDFSANRFPMPIDVTGKDEVAIGRIRKDISNSNAIELWLCGDQIRKGAALNAIQIAELLINKQ